VVLAVGMEPSVKGVQIPAEVILRFLRTSSWPIKANGGIFGAGCGHQRAGCEPLRAEAPPPPALRAIQVVNKVARAEA
jgi:quinone-modifying oxidoreductase subunit QmoA